ncbi:MAG TPA: AI-2E family transporter [Acidimicrobiales bacterium]|nr:AI-2E family transporter [Acidimicrobiales bacterium]
MPDAEFDAEPRRNGRPRVPRALEVATAWSWRLLVVGIALYGLALVIARLRLVLLPVGIALLLATVLVPVKRAMTDRNVPTPLAMLGTVAVFFGGLALVAMLIVPPLVDEFSDLNTTLDEAVDDVEDWLVTGPLGLDREWVRDVRERIEQSAEDAKVSDGAVVSGATLVGEVFAGLILSLVVTFFVVKDGPRIQRAFLGLVPDDRRDHLRAAGNAAWRALGGYLRGAAILGVVEGAAIGITLVVTGASLALPVATLTFIAAFFPFVGAIVAGLIAVAVAFVTGGTTAAGVVAIVAVVVQQLDNDLLAPVIYGKALELHPLVVILALTSGAALAGIAGAFVAVPLVAVGMRAYVAVRAVAEGASAEEATELVTGEAPHGG